MRDLLDEVGTIKTLVEIIVEEARDREEAKGLLHRDIAMDFRYINIALSEIKQRILIGNWATVVLLVLILWRVW